MKTSGDSLFSGVSTQTVDKPGLAESSAEPGFLVIFPVLACNW